VCVFVHGQGLAAPYSVKQAKSHYKNIYTFLFKGEGSVVETHLYISPFTHSPMLLSRHDLCPCTHVRERVPVDQVRNDLDVRLLANASPSHVTV
jgi:hypothetical protein